MEVQNILRKMTTGIKVLYSIRNILPEKKHLEKKFTCFMSSSLLFCFDKWFFAESPDNFRETIKLGCSSVPSQEGMQLIESSPITIQNFTCVVFWT